MDKFDVRHECARWHGKSLSAANLTVASSGTFTDPWLASISALVPIIQDYNVGAYVAGVGLQLQCIVRDGQSGIAQVPVQVIIGGNCRVGFVITAGTFVSAFPAMSNAGLYLGYFATILPSAAGLIDVGFDFATAGTKSFTIIHKHIVAASTIALP